MIRSYSGWLCVIELCMQLSYFGVGVGVWSGVGVGVGSGVGELAVWG